MRTEFEPHEKPRPDPMLTVEEFRTLYTAEHRKALCDAIQAQYAAKKLEYIHAGIIPEEAARSAARDTDPARHALQLIWQLHPAEYAW